MSKKHRKGKAKMFNQGQDTPKKVFQYGSAEVWAGSSRGASGGDWDLIVCLETQPPKAQEPQVVKTFWGADKWFKALVPPPVEMTPYLHIPIQDRSYPDLDIGWWKNFGRQLAALKGMVYVHCMAGHGRTGLFLSALAAVAMDLKIKGFPQELHDDPVKWVRTNYCKSAVESPSQMNYLKMIFGNDVTQEKDSDASRVVKTLMRWDSKQNKMVDDAEWNKGYDSKAYLDYGGGYG